MKGGSSGAGGAGSGSGTGAGAGSGDGSGAGVGEGDALENEVMEEGNTRCRSGLNMLGSGIPSVTVTTTHSVAVSVSTIVLPRSWRTGLATARIALEAARRIEDLILRSAQVAFVV
jgi:hypothetical protein